jgi:CheY-like chemotaxis protein
MDERAPVLHSRATTTRDGTQPRHVLVVDDERVILDIFRELLADEGCDVTGLGSPPSCDEIVCLAPDAIILDLVFGGCVTGLGLLRALRGNPKTASIPIIVCTALANPGVATALAASETPVPVLPKPFDLDDAIAAIRMALDRSVTGCSG